MNIIIPVKVRSRQLCLSFHVGGKAYESIGSSFDFCGTPVLWVCAVVPSADARH
jgi:hypothetical protein